ncbi:MAG: 3-dehydroquinate synthase [Acidaminococcaceae bacterium]|nr:3-dehydroquinate synthase [Acidaminococcaceae bacterium]
MKVSIPFEKAEYEIFVENGGLLKIDEKFSLKNRHVLLVTDEGVPAKYSEVVAKQCNKVLKICLPKGEKTKCFDKLLFLTESMQKAGFTRNSCIVAVGGGVISDLCGLVASIYMRGIDLYIVPTTLMAQADASVGGKNAINYNGVKNFIGTFYQPSGILVDPQVLQTLDKRYLAEGFVELIKIAVTCDKNFFEQLEKIEPFSLLTDRIIKKGIELKKGIIEQDPEEKGLRRVLNFGHTIGHAIESAEQGKLLHGECVGIGMLAFCSNAVQTRILKLLQKWNLPTSTQLDMEVLHHFIQYDKKRLDKKIRVVYVEKIGSFQFLEETVSEILQRVEKIR